MRADAILPLPMVLHCRSLGNVRQTTIIVFIRILATATINFNLAGVRLLIEDGFNFGATPLGDIDTID